MDLLQAEVPQYLPVILERYKKYKAGKFSFQNLKFSEYLDDADDTGAFDVYFICSDGIVPVHRLVVANVSKYIMSMLDDQPPWFPVKIHVPDLSTEIVQILVDLAYSGEMRFPLDLQGRVIDAMHCLGWIHTDCLSAEFIDVTGEQADICSYANTNELRGRRAGDNEETLEETGLSLAFPSSSASSGLSESSGSVSQTSPKRKLFFETGIKPVLSGSGAISFNEDDEESMEISKLPDVDVSDSEDGYTFGMVKQQFSRVDMGSILSKPSDLMGTEVTPPKTPERSSRRVGVQKPNHAEKNEEELQQVQSSSKKLSSTPSASKTPLRRGARDQKTPVMSAKKSKEIELPEAPKSVNTTHTLSPEVASESKTASSSGNPESPSKRQRRKPKRFEEFEEIPETSRAKMSPTKNTNRGGKTASVVSPPNACDNGNGSVDDVVAVSVQVGSSKTVTESTSAKKDHKNPSVTGVQATKSSNGNGSEEPNNLSQSSVKKPPTTGRKKGVSAERNSLITSFFSKKEENLDASEETGSNNDGEPVELNSLRAETSINVVEQDNKPKASGKRLSRTVLSNREAKDQKEDIEKPMKQRGSRRVSNVSTSTNGSCSTNISGGPKSKRRKTDDGDETTKSGATYSDDDFEVIGIPKPVKKIGKKAEKSVASVEVAEEPVSDDGKSQPPKAPRKLTRGTKKQDEGADDPIRESRMRPRKATKDGPETSTRESTESGGLSSRRSSKNI